jgi:hypothetical protein
MDYFPYKYSNENAEIYYLIVDVGNDKKVLSEIKDREKGLLTKGYEKIIGLRDMYSQKYDKRSNGVINENITNAFIDNANTEIENMSEPSKIKILFAIMELEAWFLGIHIIFERMNPVLNVGYIEKELGFNLNNIDPQTEFFKPSNTVHNILRLVNIKYKKSKHDIESICSKINESDFRNLSENGKCNSFRNLYLEIQN